MPTTLPRSVPPDYAQSRDSLHRVAVHVMARRRHAATGRFGLRATPGGFGTPQFGDPEHEEQLRISGPTLLHERRDDAGVHTVLLPLDGTTLRELASAVGVELTPEFSVGKDTPPVGDADAPLTVGADAVAALAAFLQVGALALDATLVASGAGADPGIAQLWPEHFDLGLDVAVGASRANLGASVGDGYHGAPYVYVGPWGGERPGDAAYWNAPFGALLGHDAIAATDDAVGTMVQFFRRGLGFLA